MDGTGNTHGALGADVGSVLQSWITLAPGMLEVDLEAGVTAPTVDTVLGNGLHRAALQTLQALLSGLVPALFFSMHQGMIAQIGRGYQAAQAAAAALGGNHLGIDAEGPQAA
jgi:hypothetical protein